MSKTKYHAAKNKAEQLLQANLKDAISLAIKEDTDSDDIVRAVATIGNGIEQAAIYLQGQGFSQRQAREVCRNSIPKLVTRLLIE